MKAINRRFFLCVVGSMLAVTFSFLCESAAAEESISPSRGFSRGGQRGNLRKRKEKRRPLKRISPIFVSDQTRILPYSRVELRLGETTKIRLGERARLNIDRFLMNTGGEITLDAGAMLFEKRDGRPTPVEIRSSYGLIAVRGTRFFAGPSNKVFGVFVEEGTVTVTAGGRRVVLRAGEGTDIRSPGMRPTAPKRWGEPRIRAAYASVR